MVLDAGGPLCEEGNDPDSNRLSPPPPHPREEGEGEEGDMEEERVAARLSGMIQSFDYQHGQQSRRGFEENFRDEDFGDEEPPHSREVFDYNHRPPHWDVQPLPPHLPPMAPRGPFESWGPPPPHLPPPPDLPPPIPYFDLPAGLMVAVVPVSWSCMPGCFSSHRKRCPSLSFPAV